MSEEKKREQYLSDLEREFLLFVAHKAIESTARGEEHLSLDQLKAAFEEFKGHSVDFSPDSPLFQVGDAFVSIYVDGSLRGCIGTFARRDPLWKTVQMMAENAASRDPRFAPLSPAELTSARVEISVLTPPVPVKNLNEIVVGRDGLIAERGPARGVLLPQVPVENRWSKEEFIAYTCLKAGLPPQACNDPDTKFYRFEALVFSDPDLYKLDK